MTSLLRIVALVALLAGGTLTTFAQNPPASGGAGREGYASVPGARLFYTDTGGAGVPVVLLHAATGNTSAWQYQTRAFATAGYRLIAYDRRGWGRTVVDPNGPAGTGADDLRGLLDSLGLDRVHVVATAGGGFVAFDFALSFATRLRSLVVADSIGGVRDKEILDLETRIRPPQFDALPPEVRELSPGYRAANPEGTQRWVDIEKESRPSRSGASTLQLAYSTPMRNQLTLSLFEQIRTPALLLTGGADMTAPPALMKILASHIPNAEFLVVPNAGHSVYWEEPELFNGTVLDFIRKH
jgi:pimeloyl-ACP methyl ester carboxylesterase